VSDYLAFLRIPGVVRLLFASTFGRLAYAMSSLAIYFQVESITQSVAVAGLAVGLSAGLGAMTAGPRGLIVDRFGQTRPLFAFVPAFALSSLLLAVVAKDAATAIGLSALMGLTAPPINISIRPLWIDIVGLARVRMAYSVDTAFHNMVMLLGPVIATLVALRISPAVAVGAVGVSMLAGGLLLAVNAHSRAWVPEPKLPGEKGMLRSPAMRLLAVEGVCLGLAFGFITIGIPSLATVSGQDGLAGPTMAAMGVGAIIGSLWAGAKAKDIAPAHGLRAASILLALALLPLGLVPIGPWMMLVVLVAWMFLGPAEVFYLEVVDIVRPRGTAVAALGSLWMIEGAAMAVGNAVGGWVAEGISPHLTLALGSLAACLSPVVFSIGIRGVLKPAADAPASAAADRVAEDSAAGG
jgi:predicted MFS family arabinose efflux permease